MIMAVPTLPRAQLDNIFTTFVENLELVFNKLKEEDSPRPTSPGFSLGEFWIKLEVAFESVSAEVTKLALWFSKPPLPKPEECQSLMTSVEMSTLALVSVFYGLPKEQGLILRKDTRHCVIKTIEGVQLLAKQIKQDQYNSSQSQLHSTGNVWERCDAFKTLARNNKDALLELLKGAEGLVKDAAEELQELRETDGESQSWEDQDQISMASNSQETLSNDDKTLILPPCAGLVKASRSCVKKVSSAVRANGQLGNVSLVAQLDDLGEIAQQISPAVDEMVMCLYPPIRHQDVRQNANKLCEVLLNLLERAKTSHITKDEDNQWLTFLSKAVDHNLEKITRLTALPSDDVS